MKKIAIVTATRAEYGLLSQVIKELRKFENDGLRVDLIVTGTHLKEEYGYTIQEIERDGIRIDKKVDIPVKSETADDISNNLAAALIMFSKLFSERRYDAVILLGDRYETLAFAIAAGNTHTPIFHIAGGDTTEGAIDEWIRHSISKMSYLHFTTNKESRRRVIQMGENPLRVFDYGSTSIDNILRIADMDLDEALEGLGLDSCKYAICTYHPVTMEEGTLDKQIHEFIEALKSYPDIEFIITKSNADQGGLRINNMLSDAEKNISNLHVFASLGARRYLSLMKHAEFVIGNSSSGIIEAPTFHIPTVNIGDRQKGRLQTESIINCKTDKGSIIDAIRLALSQEMRDICAKVVSPYGDGTAAEKIAKKSVEIVLSENINLKKKFYDLEV
jgi:GDP/UDP-N,N'-diacetylbacillosamine 2-epimerase (hydrolysing)